MKYLNKNFHFTGILVAALIFASVLCGYFFFSALKYYHEHPQRKGDLIYRDDPVLGFTLRAGVSIPGKSVSVFTDNRGVRIAEGKAVRNPKILVTGCSFTFGLGLPYRESYPAQLSSRLHLPAYNLGVSGYSTVTSLLRAKEFLDLKPKFVIYGLMDDHFIRNVIPCARALGPICRPTPYLTKNGSKFQMTYSHENDLRNFQYTKDLEIMHRFGWRDFYWAVMRDWLRVTGKDANSQTMAAQNHPREYFAEAMKFELGRFRQLTVKNNFDLIVLYIPDPGNPAPLADDYLQAVTAHEGEPRFHFIDATKPFLRYLEDPSMPRNALCLSASDCHPGKVANEILAEVLAPVITVLKTR